MTLLEVKNLTVKFKEVTAVNNISFSLGRSEALGILGQSGSGKSTLGLSLLRLVEPFSGTILFHEEELRPEVRGSKISMIFQDPFTSLNPVYTVGEQLAETFRLHHKVDKKEALKRAVEMLRLTRINNPEKRIHDYPHQFSGGMKQRVVIAIALACKPEILIADEPTTALDTTVQKEILDLIAELQNELKFSIIFITHNFGIIKTMCKRVLVMKEGKIIEEAAVEKLLESAKHPYTRELIGSLKKLHAL